MELMEGHEWLQANVGVRPRTGYVCSNTIGENIHLYNLLYSWSIDPFGHSPVMSYALSQMGFDGIVINRVPKETKGKHNTIFRHLLIKC
jgi:alpha-mannosidase II